jgi:hypothetical protein
MAYKIKKSKEKKYKEYKNYELSDEERTKLRDKIDESLKKNKGETWGNINNLVADAYARGRIIGK